MTKIKRSLFIILQYLMPTLWVSRLAGLLSHCTIPWFKNFLIHQFIYHYKVDMSEAQESDYKKYPHFNAFFSRSLMPNSRPIAQDSGTFVSPADGTISAFGEITHNECIQAKGKSYGIPSLLLNTLPNNLNFSNTSSPFEKFITIYLAPHNYHRVHMPFAGQLTAVHYIPGSLFSVNTLTTNTIPHLFLRNERVILYFNTSMGTLAMILVGACLVGSIYTPWTGIITPKLRPFILNKSKIISHPIPITSSPLLKKGDEVGGFQMGSTVILLLPKASLKWLSYLNQAPIPIKMGTGFASLISSSPKIIQ